MEIDKDDWIVRLKAQLAEAQEDAKFNRQACPNCCEYIKHLRSDRDEEKRLREQAEARIAQLERELAEAQGVETDEGRTGRGGKMSERIPTPLPLDGERCSYRCPYYMDGPVLSLCGLNNTMLRYDGKVPPLRSDLCKEEL